MAAQIFDTHAHYNDSAFSEDLEEVLAGFSGAGIGKAVNVCYDLESIDRTLALMEKHPGIFYSALGIHPSDSGPLTDEALEEIRKKLKTPGVVAVGEIGLDYHYDEPSHEIQHHWFREQLRMASKEGLPFIIHSRDAAEDTFRILKEENAQETGGVIHCYSYSAELAKEYVKLGYYIGVGGVVTYKNGRKLKETVEAVPLRGTRNSSLNLPYVVAEIARIKNVSEEEVRAVTWGNACRLYRLSK